MKRDRTHQHRAVAFTAGIAWGFLACLIVIALMGDLYL